MECNIKASQNFFTLYSRTLLCMTNFMSRTISVQIVRMYFKRLKFYKVIMQYVTYKENPML